jgi:hypothetical protein
VKPVGQPPPFGGGGAYFGLPPLSSLLNLKQPLEDDLHYYKLRATRFHVVADSRGHSRKRLRRERLREFRN